MARRCKDYKFLYLYGCPTLIIYKCHYYQTHALGLTNLCVLNSQKYWTWFIDYDSEPPWGGIPNDWWLITKTTKGYHVYLDIWENSQIRAFKKAYKWYKLGADKGHLQIAKSRMRHKMEFSAVVRVVGKYNYEDIRIVKIKEPEKIPEFYASRIIELVYSMQYSPQVADIQV